jgi:RimJ/RimL family protein N-acetyltransferase
MSVRDRLYVVGSVESGRGAELEAFLRATPVRDSWLLHCLATHGTAGFFGLAANDRLVGAALRRQGAICAADATPLDAAPVLARALLRRGAWGSVVGPDPICHALVEELAGGGELRVDRAQVQMAVTDAAALCPGEPGLRPAVRDDLDALVSMIARYRVEDGLAPQDEDQRRWIRDHSRARIDENLLYVIESEGRLVFTGAFNFLGPCGGGLGGIYTEPPWRGQGIARRATASLCRIALSRGPLATLHVRADNAPALRCYERAGLERVGPYRLTFR